MIYFLFLRLQTYEYATLLPAHDFKMMKNSCFLELIFRKPYEIFSTFEQSVFLT